MVTYRICTREDIGQLKTLRRMMLEENYGITASTPESRLLYQQTDRYLETFAFEGILAVEGDRVVGCASICYQSIIPVPLHPAGKRGYIQFVYVIPERRQQGICRQMLSRLLERAMDRETTEIILDTTEIGRPVYEKLGFTPFQDSFVLILPSGRSNNE